MNHTTRREFLKDAALAGAALTTFAESNLLAAAPPAQARAQSSAVAAVASGVTLSWLAKDPPAFSTGVSWGVPWPQGRIARGATFSLTAEAKALPLQSWPLAYWPDGSIKWTGFASVLPAGFQGPLTLFPGSTATGAALTVRNDGKQVLVDTGTLQCAIPLTGANLVTSMSIAGKPIAGVGQLVCVLQSGPSNNPEDSPRRERYVSAISRVTVEQQGRVRAVVRAEERRVGKECRSRWSPYH